MTQPTAVPTLVDTSRPKSTVAARLAELVGELHVLIRTRQLLVDNPDGLPADRRQPRRAAFPRPRQQTLVVVQPLAVP